MATADVLKLANIDPEFKKMYEEDPPPPPIWNIHEIRVARKERARAFLKSMKKPVPNLVEVDITIPARDGYQIPVRIHKPQKIPAGGCPLVVMYHGGGFCLGGIDSLEGEILSCRAFVQHFNAICLNVDYRLAPEWRFPVPVNDAYDALEWAAANYHTSEFLRGAAPVEKGFIVGGTSAGGNFTAVVTHLARDNQLDPPLTGQYLSVPALLPPDVVPDRYREQYLSCEQNTNAPILPKAAIDKFMEHYKPDYRSKLFAPFNDPAGHAGLPPAYFQVCGMDPYRDENLIYEKILRDDFGIKTRLDLYPGLPHAFWLFYPTFRSSVKWREDTIKGVGWLLGQEALLGTDVGTPVNAHL